MGDPATVWIDDVTFSVACGSWAFLQMGQSALDNFWGCVTTQKSPDTPGSPEGNTEALRVQAEGWAHQGLSAGLVLIGSEAASGRESVVTSPVCSWEVERLLLVILSGSRDGLCLPDSQLLSSGFPARHPLF